jgi:hypothetical protein
MEEPTMRKLNRLPREEATSEDGLPRADGLPAGTGPTDSDVEGHRAGAGDRFGQRMPGTGGDIHGPSGGEVIGDDDDVEGHTRLPGTGGDFAPRLPRTGGELAPRLPGTGGDYRRPIGTGEATDDDVEGHRSNP